MKTLHTIYTNFAKRLAVVLSLLVTIGVTSVVGQTWELVTNVSNLAAGDEVVIVANSANYALSTTQNSNNRGQASVTKNNNTPKTVTWTGTSVQVLTLKAGKTSGTFAFYTGSGYLYAASSSSNYLRTETTLSANSSWSITITSAGVATIKATGSNTRNWLRYNSGSSIFSCYSSGQGDVCIYKKVSAGYTITYNTNGGSTIDPATGTKLPNPLPTPTKTGYTFAGWYTNSALTAAATAGATINADITLYAKWTPTQYTITYNGLEGATHSNPTNYTIESETITFTAPSERIGYNFMGWNPASIAKGSTGNKTVTAQWTEKALTNYRTSCSTETLVSVLPQITNFWQSIFGVSLGYLRDKTGYRHVLGGIVVVSLHHKCTKIDFHHINMSRTAFVGLCLFVWQTTERFFVSRGQPNDPCPFYKC